MPLQKTPEQVQRENNDKKNEIKTATNMFKQTWQEQFYPVKVISQICQVLFPLFSVCLGITFIAFLLENQIPILAICFIVAALFLSIIELSKYYSIRIIFARYFANNGWCTWLIGVAFVLQSLSVTFTLLGAKELYIKTDNKTTNIVNKYMSERDSLNKMYDSKITILQSEIDSIKKSKRVTDWNFELIRSGVSSVQALENDRKEKQKELKAEYETLKSIATDKAGFNITLYIIISIFIEIMIVLSNLFIVYYNYTIQQDKENLLRSLGIENVVNINQELNKFKNILSVTFDEFTPKQLNKNAHKNEIEFSQLPEISNSYDINKLNQHYELSRIIYDSGLLENNSVSNENYRNLIPQIQNLEFKSITLVKTLFSIMKTIGNKKLKFENGEVKLV